MNCRSVACLMGLVEPVQGRLSLASIGMCLGYRISPEFAALACQTGDRGVRFRLFPERVVDDGQSQVLAAVRSFLFRFPERRIALASSQKDLPEHEARIDIGWTDLEASADLALGSCQISGEVQKDGVARGELRIQRVNRNSTVDSLYGGLQLTACRDIKRASRPPERRE